MDPLKTSDRVIRTVSHFDLEDFARKAYGLEDYSFITTEGDAENGHDYAFTVSGKDVNLNDDEEDIALIKAGIEVPSFRNGLLLDLLALDGLIVPGYYLVQVAY